MRPPACAVHADRRLMTAEIAGVMGGVSARPSGFNEAAI